MQNQNRTESQFYGAWKRKMGDGGSDQAQQDREGGEHVSAMLCMAKAGAGGHRAGGLRQAGPLSCTSPWCPETGSPTSGVYSHGYYILLVVLNRVYPAALLTIGLPHFALL